MPCRKEGFVAARGPELRSLGFRVLRVRPVRLLRGARFGTLASKSYG